MIDPVLYLEVSTNDSHRLVNWRLHWLPPTYNPPDYPSGQGKAKRGHSISCSLVEPQMHELLEVFGAVPELNPGVRPIDYILNCLARSDVGLTRRRWEHVWLALLRVLRQIDKLIHTQDDNEQSGGSSTEPPILDLIDPSPLPPGNYTYCLWLYKA